MLELTLRIVFSLAIVLGLLWMIARVLRKPLRGRSGGVLTVLARQQLGRTAAIAVVRVADQALVVGITEGQVSLLAETDLATVERATEAAAAAERRSPVPLDAAPAPRTGPLAGSALSPRTWLQTVEFLRERTARRT